MRPLIATACICLLTSAGSIASDQKAFVDRLNDASAIAPVPRAAAPSTMPITDELLRTADRLSPPADSFDPLPAAKAKPVVHRSTQEVCDTVTRAAQRNDLPVPFFIRLLFQESRFKPGAVSRAGAQGIAQFMPHTADAVGLDNPFDPLQAIPASARLLRGLFDQFGNLGLAAAAYNAGPKRIHDWLARKGKLPDETQGYVKTITGRPAESWKTASTGTPAMKLPERAPCQDAAGLLTYNGPDVIPVPAEAPRHAERISKHEKIPPVKVAAHHHHRHNRNTINLAARRKTGHGHRKSRGHRVASATP